MSTSSDRLELWDVHRLHPAPLNPRHHGEDDLAELAASIRRFGFRAPILATTDGEIVAGEGRWRAAQALGLKRVPVVLVEGLDAEERAAYLVPDNRIAELSRWDDAELAGLLSTLEDLAGVGYTDAELEELQGAGPPTPERDPPPPAPAKPITRAGDVWILGEHRVVCGNALDPGLWGQRATLVVADPPYGIALADSRRARAKGRYQKKHSGRALIGDDLQGKEFEEFITKTCAALFQGLRAGGSVYMFHPEAAGLDVLFRRAFVDAGFKSAQVLIWVKDAFTLGRQDYHFRHESILYGWRPGAAHYFRKDRTQDTVWEYPSPRRSEDHPTMKPVELVARIVRNSAKPKALVVDPFLGSGTTLIACQELGRRCHGIEIEPAYVDVAIRRWQAQTGELARDADGHTLEERRDGQA